MQLYVGPYHMVSAEIAVAMAVPFVNATDYEVRGVIRFLQDDEILSKKQTRAWNCSVARQCPADTSLAA